MEDNAEGDNKSKSRRLNRFGRSKSEGKNVLRNVDMSSEEFDSPYDDDFDEKYNNDADEYHSDRESSPKGRNKSRSLFDKINMFNKDKDDDLNDGFDDGFDDDDFDDLDFITPVNNEESGQRGSKKSRNHTFKSSKDADIFDNLDDYVEDSKAQSKPKPKSKAKSKSKSQSKSKAKSGSKKPKVEEPTEEEEYEDFSDDFFDDGVFGDEGYESLLDDYVEKPKKSSSNKKSAKRQLDDDGKYYDYEGKGADSVFNLDE